MDDDRPFLEKNGDINLTEMCQGWENCNLVSIDCNSVWFDFVFGCVGQIDPVVD